MKTPLLILKTLFLVLILATWTGCSSEDNPGAPPINTADVNVYMMSLPSWSG